MLAPHAMPKLSEDSQHLPVKRLGLSQPVGGAEQLGQVVEVCCHVGVLRAQVIGHPKAHGQHLLRREKKLEQTPQRPSYVLSLEISVVENDPVEDSSMQAIYERVYEYKNRVLKAFES